MKLRLIVGTMVAVTITSTASLLAQDSHVRGPSLTFAKSLVGDRMMVKISNTSSHTVTAFLVIAKQFKADGRIAAEFHNYVDMFYNFHDSPLLSGESRVIEYGSSAALGHDDDVQLKAAVFDDGSTYGDKVWIDHILAKREILAQSLREISAMCAAMRSSGAPTRGAIVEQFRHFEQDRNPLIPSIEEQMAVSQAAGNAIGLVTKSTVNGQLYKEDQALDLVIEQFAAWQARLATAALQSSQTTR